MTGRTLQRTIVEGVRTIGDCVGDLQRRFPAPDHVDAGGGIKFFRYEEQDATLLCQLKCVYAVSVMNACCCLSANGFYLEVGALCRCLSEAFEDIIFMSSPLSDEGVLTSLQDRMMRDFFQEEFADPTKIMTSQIKRDRPPRDKVQAALAALPENALNASDAKLITQALMRATSGYVHGAYPHIMEIYGATSPQDGHFANAEPVPSSLRQTMDEKLASHVLQVAFAVSYFAIRNGVSGIKERLEGVVSSLMSATGSAGIADLDRAAKQVKEGRPPIG